MQVEPWIENITKELKKHTDRPIQVRYKFTQIKYTAKETQHL